MIKEYKCCDEFLNNVFARRKRGFDMADSVRKIVSDVAESGDKALFDYTKKFDKVDLDANNIRVTKEEISKCYDEVDPKLVSALMRAKDNIVQLCQSQVRQDNILNIDGKRIGYMVRPVDRAGIYVPGGLSPYPSSVLMCALPAKVAGVGEIVMCTPIGNGLNPLTIVAADICGVSEIYKVGGAQAIAATAYGTDSVKRADVITGPGNIYVALAKKEVLGIAGIDMIAGPSEILIIADESADPKSLAADLLGQAEHDEMAMSVLITTDKNHIKSVSKELTRQIAQLGKSGIAKKSIETNGAIVCVDSLAKAVEISNLVAPEHLELCVAEPDKLLDSITSAGAVFVGHYSPEPLGDYFAGPNHVLPTEGSARFFSSLGIDNYIKKISIIEYDKSALKAAKDDIIALAEAEGFGAHANAIRVRFEEDDKK